jgi:hypothetical protein
MSLIYCPVSTDNKNLVNLYHPYCLFNPIRQTNITINNFKRHNASENFGDSGGYQIYRFNEDKARSCIVVSAVGIRYGSNLIVIDPIDLCRRYGEFEIKYGFTVDQPLSDNPTQKEFRNNLEKSYIWADLMFEHRSQFCPDTELLIPLHFSTKDQLHIYYDEMSQLNPYGYAFPVRGFFDLSWIVRISCALCFLHSKKAKMVHMFGSSRREVIIIGAAAVGLGMFDKISFDSRSWNILMFDKRPTYIDPKTLSRKRLMEEETIEIIIPDHILLAIQSQFSNLTLSDKKYLLMLHNAFAISRYAEDTIRRAREINNFKEYVGQMRYLSTKSDLLIAIDILVASVENGYESVQEWLKGIWL